MFIESKLKADTSAKKQGDRRGLIKTTDSLPMSIGSLTIKDFSKLKARNQALTGCFWGFAWLKTIG